MSATPLTHLISQSAKTESTWGNGNVKLVHVKKKTNLHIDKYKKNYLRWGVIKYFTSKQWRIKMFSSLYVVTDVLRVVFLDIWIHDPD